MGPPSRRRERVRKARAGRRVKARESPEVPGVAGSNETPPNPHSQSSGQAAGQVSPAASPAGEVTLRPPPAGLSNQRFPLPRDTPTGLPDVRTELLPSASFEEYVNPVFCGAYSGGILGVGKGGVVADELITEGRATKRVLTVDALGLELSKHQAVSMSMDQCSHWMTVPPAFGAFSSVSNFFARNASLAMVASLPPDNTATTFAMATSGPKSRIRFEQRRMCQSDSWRPRNGVIPADPTSRIPKLLRDGEGGVGESSKKKEMAGDESDWEQAPTVVALASTEATGGRSAGVKAGGNFRQQSRADRGPIGDLCHTVDELAESIANAQRELVSAHMRVRNMMQDGSAAQGYNLDNAALQGAGAAAAKLQEKWSSTVEGFKALHWAISNITGYLRLPPFDINYAEAKMAGEQCRRELDEKTRQLEEVNQMLLSERQMAAKLRVKLEQAGAVAQDDLSVTEGPEAHPTQLNAPVMRELVSPEDERSSAREPEEQVDHPVFVSSAQESPPRPASNISSGVVRAPASDSVSAAEIEKQVTAISANAPMKMRSSDSAAHDWEPRPPVHLPSASRCRIYTEKLDCRPAKSTPQDPPAPTPDESLGSPQHNLSKNWLVEDSSNLARGDDCQEIPSNERPIVAGDAVELDALVRKLAIIDAHSGSGLPQNAPGVVAAGAPETTSPDDQGSEADWEAMISQFEAEEQRIKPLIRHRIHIAKIHTH